MSLLGNRRSSERLFSPEPRGIIPLRNEGSPPFRKKARRGKAGAREIEDSFSKMVNNEMSKTTETNEMNEMLMETISDCDRMDAPEQAKETEIYVSPCEEENDLFWKCTLQEKIA